LKSKRRTSAETRDVFREALQVDNATWARDRGWALSVGLIALPYYQDANPALAGIARRAIHEALADYRANGWPHSSRLVLRRVDSRSGLIAWHFFVRSVIKSLKLTTRVAI